MYDSPIDKFYGEMKSQIVQNEDEYLMVKVSQTIGYDIDKDELIKALNYDRKQYEKGYEDGLNANRWIPVTERMPEEDGTYLITLEFDDDIYDPIVTSVAEYHDGRWDRFELFVGNVPKIIAWMQLPEPWKKVIQSEHNSY